MSDKVQRMALFFGGFFDGTFKPVLDMFNAYSRAGSLGRRVDLQYFSHDAKFAALKYIRENLATDGKIALIGHSYGGDTAYLVARDIGIPSIEYLVTVDPVSRWTFNIRKPPRVKNWINVWVEGIQDLSDIVAVAGGHWGKMDGASNYKVSNLSHANFGSMLLPHLAQVARGLR